jgi:predicted dehydrogenase
VPRIHLVSNLPGANALGDHLRAAGLGPTSARSADALLVLIDRPLDHVEQELLDRARQTVPVLLAGPTIRALSPESPLVEASGLLPGRTTPAYELMITAGPDGARVAARLGDFRPFDTWVVPDKVADDVERLLMINHEWAEHPVCTWRPSTGLGMFTLGSAAATLADPAYHRLVGRWLRHALGEVDAEPVRVGLLGRAEPVAAHCAAIEATDGLEVVAICDDDTTRPSRSGRGARRADDGGALVNDPDVALVVVATPTCTRSEWASRALQAGKHVVVDAPFALTTADADGLARTASARSLVLAVHSERHDDPAVAALCAAVRAGSVGDVLWAQTFDCGFRRPAGGWHDDAKASGGLAFDRGYAEVDWLLDLIDAPVEWVSSTGCKRVWHHVSNADHTRILIHFAGGVEAQITISDLATAPFPRLHLLGSKGEIYLDGGDDGGDGRPAGRHAGPRAEPVSRPLTLATHDGARTRLPARPPEATGFHRALADCLVSGWPASFGVERARTVLAVVEAAARSEAAGGGPVVPAVPPAPPAGSLAQAPPATT